ncbi:MAG: Rrf2 family transcriptional regulator [Gemmatimonadota bacterium]
MRLTQFSDYALRTLLYLGVHRADPVPVAQVARAYGISYHHLVKVAAQLTELGMVEATRGRGGGLRLIVPAEAVNLGELIRNTEPDLHLVECFDAATDSCPITPTCGLRHLLYDARKAFLDVLDGQTLADLLAPPGQAARLQALWLDEDPPTRAVAQ